MERARTGKLKPDDYHGSTFTIMNLGMMGIDGGLPLIYPPQTAILGVYSSKRVPVVVESVDIRTMMNMVLVADHRVLDGVPVSAFLNSIKALLQDPEKISGSSCP